MSYPARGEGLVNSIFDCFPSLPPSADRPSPGLLSQANRPPLLLSVVDFISPSSFVNWPSFFSGTFLSSSTSGLGGDLAVRPFVWVSHQSRQRDSLTGGTHTPNTTNGRIVSQLDEDGKANFRKKIFTNRLKMGLQHRDWVEKIVNGVETHWLSGKEMVPGTAVRKEGHADCVVGNERTHHYWFCWKWSNGK